MYAICVSEGNGGIVHLVDAKLIIFISFNEIGFFIAKREGMTVQTNKFSGMLSKVSMNVRLIVCQFAKLIYTHLLCVLCIVFMQESNAVKNTLKFELIFNQFNRSHIEYC